MPLNAFAAFVKKNAGSGLNMTELSKKYKSQKGGAMSQMGGAKKPQMGGSKSYMGGAMSQMGGVRSALERQMDDVRPTFNVPKDLSSIPGIPMGVELALLETGLIYSDLEILATDSLVEYKMLFAEAVRSVDPTVSGVNQAAESSYAYFRAQRGGAKNTQKAGAKKSQKAGAKKTQKAGAKKTVTKRK